MRRAFVADDEDGAMAGGSSDARSARTRPLTVAVIGDALVDEVVVDGVTTRHPGGSALNVAIGLAFLGVPATLLASIGDDADGELIRGALAARGVGLRATPNGLGTGLATSERVDGEPRYAFNDAAVARDLDFGDDQLAAIRRARVVAVSGFPFDGDSATERLLSALDASDAQLAVDPNPRAGLIRDLPRYRRAFEEVVSRATLVKLGGEDLELLYGHADDELRARISRRCGMLLATEGPHGASLWVDGVRTAAAPALARRVVDAMGAGDATFATFVARLAEERGRIDGQQVLEQAMRIAAATVAQPGALLRTPPEG